MYAYINGKLVYKCPTYVVIDAGGVGYHINISLNTYSSIGDKENYKLFVLTFTRGFSSNFVSSIVDR